MFKLTILISFIISKYKSSKHGKVMLLNPLLVTNIFLLTMLLKLILTPILLPHLESNFVVNDACHFKTSPFESHHVFVKRILTYLKRGLHYIVFSLFFLFRNDKKKFIYKNICK